MQPGAQGHRHPIKREAAASQRPLYRSERIRGVASDGDGMYEDAWRALQSYPPAGLIHTGEEVSDAYHDTLERHDLPAPFNPRPTLNPA